jgi:hypothetical protein
MKVLLCKDCTYISKIPLINKVIRNDYEHTCTHADSWTEPPPDYVLGLARTNYYKTCEQSRAYGEKCGISARNYTPKDE